MGPAAEPLPPAAPAAAKPSAPRAEDPREERVRMTRLRKRIAERLRETDEQMESLMIRDNTSRLVNILAKQVKGSKMPGGFSINIDDLAGMAGIEKNLAHTIIGKLANVKIVEVAGDVLRILNQEQVDRLVKYLEMREIFGELL